LVGTSGSAVLVAGLLDEPTAGVLRMRGSPPTWRQRMMVATLIGPGFHAGFRAAAHLHRLDGFQHPQPIEVVGGPSCRRIRGLDVIQHWIEPLPPVDLVLLDGIPCTGLARSVVDVCVWWTPTWLYGSSTTSSVAERASTGCG
jgi:hypothetical protein